MKVTTLTAAQQTEVAELQKTLLAARAAMIQANLAMQTALQAIVGASAASTRLGTGNIHVSEDGQHLIS